MLTGSVRRNAPVTSADLLEMIRHSAADNAAASE
jgi:hypothetical protein